MITSNATPRPSEAQVYNAAIEACASYHDRAHQVWCADLLELPTEYFASVHTAVTTDTRASPFEFALVNFVRGLRAKYFGEADTPKPLH